LLFSKDLIIVVNKSENRPFSPASQTGSGFRVPVSQMAWVKIHGYAMKDARQTEWKTTFGYLIL